MAEAPPDEVMAGSDAMLTLSRLVPWLAVVACVAGGCAGGGEDDPAGPRRLLLISVDTLRADRLETYGYQRETSPFLARFAARGAVFEHAVAESSWTLPSHVTMLTGLFPTTHGVTYPSRKAGGGLRRLPEILGEEGWIAVGLTEGRFMGESHGMDEGFGIFREDIDSLEASLSIVREALEDLSGDERAFFFVHTFAVHCPYDPPEEYAARFVSPDAEFIETAGRCGNPDYNSMELTPGQLVHVSDQYDASIRVVDDTLASFFGELERAELDEGLVVAIVSDHGEEFGEYGPVGHERTLSVESLHVPMIVVGEGVVPARIEAPVGLVDLAPTLLGLAGLDVPGEMEGRDLSAMLRGEAPEPASGAGDARISELNWQLRLRSVWTREHHLVLEPGSGESVLFELTETGPHRIDEPDPALVTTLEQRLEAYREERRASRTHRAEEVDPLSDEELERLRALGYSWDDSDEPGKD